MISLEKVWKDRAISITTKKRLLKSLVFNIATYGSECWVLKTTDKKKINSFELWCYRRLLRIKWTDKKTNENVLSKLELVKDCLLPSLNEKWLFSDMYSEKVTFVQTY